MHVNKLFNPDSLNRKLEALDHEKREREKLSLKLKHQRHEATVGAVQNYNKMIQALKSDLVEA